MVLDIVRNRAAVTVRAQSDLAVGAAGQHAQEAGAKQRDSALEPSWKEPVERTPCVACSLEYVLNELRWTDRPPRPRAVRELGLPRRPRYDAGRPGMLERRVFFLGSRAVAQLTLHPAPVVVIQRIGKHRLQAHIPAAFAAAGVPMGMVFVRNENGSHNPHEAMETDDFLAATKVLALWLAEAAR